MLMIGKLALLFLILLGSIQAGTVKEDTEFVIHAVMGPEVALEFERYELELAIKSELENRFKQRFYGDEVYRWQISRGDSLLGTALLDNVMGKAMPITILVIFDPEGMILGTDVIRYREAIGGEVSNPRWQKQFTGLSTETLLEKDRRIDGITGATISVRSVHRGILKLAGLHAYMQQKQPYLGALK